MADKAGHDRSGDLVTQHFERLIEVMNADPSPERALYQSPEILTTKASTTEAADPAGRRGILCSPRSGHVLLPNRID